MTDVDWSQFTPVADAQPPPAQAVDWSRFTPVPKANFSNVQSGALSQLANTPSDPEGEFYSDLTQGGQAMGSRALKLGKLLYGATPAGLAESVASRMSGEPSTADEIDAASNTIAPSAATTTGERVAQFIGGVAPDLAGAMLTGVASEGASLLESGVAGMRAMALPAIENTKEAYDQGIKAGMSPLGAAERAAVAGAGTALSGAIPGTFGASVPARVVSGAAVGAGLTEAQRVAENAVSPANLQQPFDPLNDILGAGMGGVLGGVLGHGSQEAQGEATAHALMDHAEQTVAADTAGIPSLSQAAPDASMSVRSVPTDRAPNEAAPVQTDATEPLPNVGAGEPGKTAQDVDLQDAPNFGMPHPQQTLPDDHPLLQSQADNHSPEREAMRQQLIDQRFEGKTPVPDGQQPMAIVMGGGGASGKGTVLKKMTADGDIPDNAVHLDPDSFKTGDATKGLEGIPEYQDIVDAGDSRAAAVTHEESSDLYKAALARAIEGNYNVVLDRTMGNVDKGVSELQALKGDPSDPNAPNYFTHLVGVSVDPETAIQRAVDRAQGPEKRFVPIDSLLTAHKGFSNAFEDSYVPLVDKNTLFDNNVPKGTDPIKMAGGSYGSMNVLDPARYNDFVSKGGLNEDAQTYRALWPEAGTDGVAGGAQGAGLDRVQAGGLGQGDQGAGSGRTTTAEPVPQARSVNPATFDAAYGDGAHAALSQGNPEVFNRLAAISDDFAKHAGDAAHVPPPAQREVFKQWVQHNADNPAAPRVLDQIIAKHGIPFDAGSRAMPQPFERASEGQPAGAIHAAAEFPRESIQPERESYRSRTVGNDSTMPPPREPPRGGEPPEPPQGPRSRPVEAIHERLQALKSLTAKMGDVVRDVIMKTSPMVDRNGSNDARVVAKDFISTLRLARFEGVNADRDIRSEFNRDQQEKMWRAADAEGVARQQGGRTDSGLASLTPREREVVQEQQARASAVFAEARRIGMVEGEALPSYVPRMVARMTGETVRPSGPARSSPEGRNLKTTTPQLQGRKHLTTEGTEAAARAKLGDDVEVVKNIRTLPLATMKLEEAIAGRNLVNTIKDIGNRTQQTLVREGSAPANDPEHTWFTIDHPALTTWRPRFETGEDGKVVPVTDSHGSTVFDKVPLYIRGDFEGPLKSVLSGDMGALYHALMTLKGKSMTAIMYSPIIHNAVEWGRALPAMPGKVLTFRVYGDGARALADPMVTREAINAGIVPITGHSAGASLDIDSIAQEDNIKAGRSITAQLASFVPDLFSERMGAKTKEAIDKAGDFYHNTLLWNQIGKLQFGIYSGIRETLAKKGFSTGTPDKPGVAPMIAAHIANRYAGAIPTESMSGGARAIANLMMFSRSFTLGNLGAMKDAIVGLPKDIQSKILAESGAAMRQQANNYTRRKAAGVIGMDIGLMYVTNSILQSAFTVMRGMDWKKDINHLQALGSDLKQRVAAEADGYVKRAQAAMQRVKENPMSLFNVAGTINSLTPMSENEPSKQNRILVGYAKDGTGIYMRNPVGKIGEEFLGWQSSPLDMDRRKLSQFAKPVLDTIANDKGFGRKLYDPYDVTPEGAVKNIGRIVGNLMGAQIPTQNLIAVGDILNNRGNPAVNTLQTLGPLAGMTFSKGAPGGPAMGEIYHEKDMQDVRTQFAKEQANRLLAGHDEAGARHVMTEAGMPRSYQDWVVRAQQNPGIRLSDKKVKDFMETATPQQIADFKRLRNQNGND